MENKSENKIQQEIFTWYNNTYCLAHHNPRCLIAAIPNGGNVTVQNRMTLLATGMLKGFSDLILIHKINIPHQRPVSRVFFIEIKTPDGNISEDQDSFGMRVIELGFHYKIFRSLVDFQNFVHGL